MKNKDSISNGMYVKVHVYPGVKKEKLIQKKNFLEIHVQEEARQNQANARVRKVLAQHFAVLPDALRIVSGHHSSRKIFSIDN